MKKYLSVVYGAVVASLVGSGVTPVTLQVAGHGMYIGPQGEIYPNLPTVDQLKEMYGK